MKKIIGLFILVLSNAALSGVILDFNSDGLLAGAKGIPISDKLYDVQFVDGTCIDVFEGCTKRPLEFVFQNDVFKALEATIALEKYVFLDEYLLDPSLTVGCIGLDSSARDYCDVETPYQDASGVGRHYGSVFLRLAPTLGPFNDGDRYFGRTSQTTFDTSSTPSVWAVWNKQPVKVSEPNILSLLIASLMVLAFNKFRHSDALRAASCTRC